MINFGTTRLVAAILCLSVALLGVIQAQSVPLWLLFLGVTEYGHWFAIAPLLLAGCGSFRTPAGSMAVLVSLAAALLFLLPLLHAAPIARQLPQSLAAEFGKVPLDGEAFNLSELWTEAPAEPVTPEPLVYAEHETGKLTLYFYRAVSTKKPAPCVVVLHTGGWNSGTPNEFLEFNYRLARLGYNVAAIDYRLAPRWKWPAQRDDVLDSLRFLKDRHEALGIDPEKFVLLGRSAGGHLAETVAFGAHDPAIRGCVAFYAPADMRFAYKFSSENDILDSPKLLRDLLGGTPEEALANYDSASAIDLVDPKSPPTLLLHGDFDPLVWVKQSKRLSEKLTAAHVPNLFVELPWATHGFDYNFRGPGGQIAAYAIEYFLADVTK